VARIHAAGAVVRLAALPSLRAKGATVHPLPALRRLAPIAATLGLAAACAPRRPAPDHPGAPPGAVAPTTAVLAHTEQGQPLVLQESEGERRVHRPPPAALSSLTAAFIIKVDRHNGGAPEFFMMTSEIAPGEEIPPHEHPHSDEIVFVRDGTGRAVLAGREVAVTAGATIYMPRNTSVRLRNTGTQPLRLIAIFSQPGYEEYMRDISVPEGAVAAPLTVEELTAIRARHRAHVVYGQP
jgi:quercetin dioxygenase-like cupin family protein